ncbi:MAG: Bis-ABC ATPase YheS [uncultured Solirubrobacterales bacterium]|uniref:Bis-ABC ATPase YheS n=1 Tax=uncultured Solirubrobacterales bacterium TaxID=768556 RepID=A0A6J4TC94_9ACTN|nr:MAG: Bis-ABC ATPase YheS [uncultured Solirubrobacterales bacterium]
MAVVIASDLSKDVAGRRLLSGVSFKLERRDRMTLSGRNGSGKTTLLRMLAGDASVDSGSLTLQKGAKIALYDQRPPRERDLSLRDYVLSGATEVTALEAELARLEQAMAAGAHDEPTLAAYGRVQERFELRGGYRWRDSALTTVRGLGFDEDELDRRLSTFSGGELTRASLARALAGDPDLLLLDEPTNHLDIASLEWLEAHLQALDAAIVLVAHDRWFLEAVGTSVLELEAGRSRFFKGPWHAWRKEHAAREIALGRAIERQQAEIARLERFVERFRAKATKARQAQSRVKRLDKIERIEDDPRDSRELSFTFKEPERSGRVVLELRDARIEVPGRVLLEDAAMHVERGEHVTLVGANGSGKTTLIDTLAGGRELPTGKLSVGHNVQLAFVSQHSEELDGQGSVLETVQRATGLTPGKARALLGRFLFSGDEAEKPVAGLSGGELKRLSIAVLVNSGANMLVLDEPTNHLDLESREALEDALRGFPGSLLLVSHDRALLDAVGTRTLAVEEGELRSYEGSWAEYVQARAERRAAERSPEPAKPKAAREPRAREERNGKAGPSKNAKRRQAALERDVEAAEAALTRIEDELANPSAWSDSERSAASTERHAGARRQVEEAYARLEAAGT